MKNKVFIIIALILSVILSSGVASYAAQARAYASVVIIIPPRDQESEKKITEKDAEEESAYEMSVASVKDDQKD